MMRLDESRRSGILQTFVDRLLATGEVSAAAAGVLADRGSAWAAGGALVPGQGETGDPIEAGTYFDLASLTKPVTATAALVLDESGEFGLGRALGSVMHDLPPAAKPLSIESLLRHRAGLIPWYPFYADRDPGEVTSHRFTDGRLWQRADDSGLYSDLGPILWSMLAAEAGHPSVSVLDLKLALKLSYAPSRRLTAATRLSNQREVELARALAIEVPESTKTLRGVSQDGNARRLREPGHAGLFGSLTAVLDFARHWLGSGTLSREQIDWALEGTGRYAMGWWRADPDRDGLPKQAFGHNGFTGGSLWIEPEGGRVMVLLAHRTSLSDTLDRARREFHQLALTLAT